MSQTPANTAHSRFPIKLRLDPRIPKHNIRQPVDMAPTTDLDVPTLPFFRLPGELRNRIYRYLTLHPTPIQITGSTKADNDLRFYPTIPKMMLTCRKMRDEIRTIYYEENHFHLLEYALRPDRIEGFRRRAGPSAERLNSITVSRAIGIDGFRLGGGFIGASLKFTLSMQSGVKIQDYTSSLTIKTPLGGDESLCCCSMDRTADSWKGSLLGFLGACMELDGTWNGVKLQLDRCEGCKKCRIVSDSTGDKFRERKTGYPERFL